MAQELRGAFHRELDRLDIALSSLIGLIPDAIRDATAALLGGDSDLSDSVARWRGLVNDLYADVDATVELVMARQAPVARDLRFLICCLRVVPEAREAVELVGWLGRPRDGELSVELSPQMHHLTLSAAEDSVVTWDVVGRLWRERTAASLLALRARGDAGSDIRSSLVAEVADSGMAIRPAMEMALVVDGYERLTGHGLAIGRLVAPLVDAGPG